MGSKDMERSVFGYLLFYVQELHLLFSIQEEISHFLRHDLNTNSGGLKREASQSFTIQVFIIS